MHHYKGETKILDRHTETQKRRSNVKAEVEMGPQAQERWQLPEAGEVKTDSPLQAQRKL